MACLEIYRVTSSFTIYCLLSTIYIDSISLIQDKDNLPIIYQVFRKSYGKEITYQSNLRSA